MKIVQINTFPYKATGSIMMGIHGLLKENGQESYVVWGRGRDAENEHEIVIKDKLGVKLHGVYTRLTDKTGFASQRATKMLLEKLDDINPDIVHLHNVHGYYINIEMLFTYLKKHQIKLVWTLHDCWPMTGHCAFFDMVGCEKWKTGCHHCEQKKTYPSSLLLDESKWNWENKKELFQGLDGVLVTPSRWLASVVGQSMLKDYPVKVVYNGIDLQRYYPRKNTQVRQKYHLDERPIVLGIASEWTERKGLKDIIELSGRMQNAQFVAVGLTERQIGSLPYTVVGIKRTESLDELCELYSEAAVFFNPTYEDNFPTTNIEALACGTPICTYNTGGSAEAISRFADYENRGLGTVIQKEVSKTADFDAVEKQLCKLMVLSIHDRERITKNCQAAASYYSKDCRLSEYLEIYEELIHSSV